jgi:hypothetical protein
MRKYISTPSVYNNLRYSNLRRGLKQVHIGGHVWLIGKQRQTEKGLHCVIYEPETYKEHHVWGKDVEDLCTVSDERDFDDDNVCHVNRHGNKSLNEKVKVFILTSILDERTNWCFDLNIPPDNGKLKVIYENGTIMNIDFQGVFEKADIRYRWSKQTTRKVKPIGYRKS